MSNATQITTTWSDAARRYLAERPGEAVGVRFDADGLVMTSAVARRFLAWLADREQQQVAPVDRLDAAVELLRQRDRQPPRAVEPEVRPIFEPPVRTCAPPEVEAAQIANSPPRRDRTRRRPARAQVEAATVGAAEPDLGFDFGLAASVLPSGAGAEIQSLPGVSTGPLAGVSAFGGA